MWYLPSKGRPHNLKRFFEAYHTTRASSPGLVLVNETDATLSAYRDILFPPQWELVVHPGNTGVWERINHYTMNNQNDNWFGNIQDDCLPETPEWDRLLIEEARRDGLAFGSDGILNGQWANNWVVGGSLQREIIREFGGMMLPGLTCLFGDNFYSEYARRRGVLRYRPDIIMAHLHFSNGKAPFDKTYEKTNYENDRKVFEAWLGSPFAA